jgi:SPP1 family predicted phage head-tail adaptor
VSDCACAPSFASQARTRVTIQQVTLTDDGIGGKTKSWTDFKTVWAIVKSVPNWRRMEMFVAQEVQARIQQTATIRYIDAISDNSVASTLRILINSRILNVTGISNLHDDMKTEGKAYQTLLCVEGEAG